MRESGSSIALTALILWVPISICVFRFLRPSHAAAVLFLGAAMFLPEKEQLKIPAIPAFDKLSIASICIFIGVLVVSRRRLTKTQWPRAFLILLAVLAVGATGSIFTNLDPVLCGLTPCDALLPHTTITFLLDYFFLLVIPFWIGMAFIRTRRELLDLLKIIVGAGLVYSLCVLIEARLSPQLHTWVYGYMQHDYLQTVRAGGYRPMAFMAHGLALALFIATSVLAAMGFTKARLRLFGFKAVVTTVYLAAILLLCRSFGALIYGVLCLLLMVFTSARTQLRVAAFVCAIAVLYPMLRAVDLFPTKELVELSSYYSPERAGSLGFRFFNEDMLLEKALKRPIFGWGGFDRIRIFDERSGEDVSITDGYWIIIFSSRGVVGFVCVFSLLVLPVFIARFRINRISGDKTRRLIACLALITTICIVDLIPNGLFNYFPFFFSGSLLGVVQHLSATKAKVRGRSKNAAVSSHPLVPDAPVPDRLPAMTENVPPV